MENITLRDIFAMVAMHAKISESSAWFHAGDEILQCDLDAEFCYAIADCMIKAKKEPFQ